MDRTDIRQHTYPVTAVEWDELYSELRQLATSAKKNRPMQASLQILEQASKQKLPPADNFWMWEIKRKSNATAELNKVLQSVKRDGCLPGGGLLPGDFYVQLSPRFIRLTSLTLQRLPERFHEVLGPLATADEYHLLIWVVNGESKPSTLWSEKKLEFDEKDRERLPRGKACKTPPGSGVALVTSPRRPQIVKAFIDALKGTVEVRKVIVGQSKLHESVHSVQIGRGTVIWVDDGVSERQLSALAGAVRPESLILTAFDEASWERVQALAKDLSLNRDYCCQVDSPRNGLPNKIAAKVRQMLEENSPAERLREDSRAEWQSTQAIISGLLESNTTDVQIVKTMVLDPARERAGSILGVNGLSSSIDAQLEFLRVAAPFYRQADEIYTLNTDRYSTFWNSGAFDEKTKQELLTRCPTVRLSLYGTPDALFRDIPTLNTQAHHYQQGGEMPEDVRLLVGDWERFRLAFPKHANEDVAFVHHTTGDWYRFFLNERKFGVTNLGREVDDPILRWLLSLKADATKLPGHITDTLTGSPDNPSFECFRWTENLQRRDIFGDAMKGVFRHNSRSGVHRILTFRNDGRIDPDKFKKIVLRVHHALERDFGDGQSREFREQYGLKSIEFGSLVDPYQPAPNGSSNEMKHNGRDEHSSKEKPRSRRAESRSREIIIIHFDTIEHLHKFSIAPALETIRRALYKDILETLGEKVGRGLSESVYSAMRAAGNRYMTIYDYTDRHDLAEWIKLMREEHELG